jgi:hypothetical protein
LMKLEYNYTKIIAKKSGFYKIIFIRSKFLRLLNLFQRNYTEIF